MDSEGARPRSPTAFYVHESAPRFTDLQVVECAKRYNETRSSVLDVGSVLDVVLDYHGKVMACGFPDSKQVFVVERRDDFNDVLHVLKQSIRSEGMREFLSSIAVMNTNRAFSKGEGSLSALLEEIMECGMRP